MNDTHRPYQRCTNCVMDTSDSAITFDEHGVCDFCNDFYQNIQPSWQDKLKDPDLLRRTAEQIKLRIGSAYPLEKLRSVSMSLRAASAADGQPRDITVTAEDVREALMLPLKTVFEAVHSVLERTPPELAADLLETGIVLTGGGALLRGLDRFLHEATGLPVHIAEHPMDCVAQGAGKTLEGGAYIPANARRAEEA